MKVFTYFVEPASYTVDLIANVHSKQEVGYAFINKESEAKTKESPLLSTFLSDFSLSQCHSFGFLNLWDFSQLELSPFSLRGLSQFH